MDFDLLMTDHPAWRPVSTGVRRLLVDDRASHWLAESDERHQLTMTPPAGAVPPPTPGFYSAPPSQVPARSPLTAPLRTLGVVARFANPSLWDALATAIVRQVIRAAQARRLYREFCDAYGPRVALSGDKDINAFPSPEHLLALSDADFTNSGMGFKCRPLRHAARAFLTNGSTWCQLTPSVLVKELQTVKGIGPWSAGAAVADWSNDWSLYPYGDLAVRTWAGHIAPEYPWPDDEAAFARAWQRLTGDHLGTYTLLTLAWGTRHGGAI